MITNMVVTYLHVVLLVETNGFMVSAKPAKAVVLHVWIPVQSSSPEKKKLKTNHVALFVQLGSKNTSLIKS